MSLTSKVLKVKYFKLKNWTLAELLLIKIKLEM